MARNGIKTGGRQKGTPNKVNSDLRNKINSFLEGNFDKITKDINALDPKDRVKFYLDLMQYGVPKLQSISQDIDFESLTDEQLDEIINRLTEKANAA